MSCGRCKYLQHINIDGRILGLQRKTQDIMFNYELCNICFAAESRPFYINLHNELCHVCQPKEMSLSKRIWPVMIKVIVSYIDVLECNHRHIKYILHVYEYNLFLCP